MESLKIKFWLEDLLKVSRDYKSQPKTDLFFLNMEGQR